MMNILSFEEYKEREIAEKKYHPDDIEKKMEEFKKQLRWNFINFEEYLHLSYAHYLYGSRIYELLIKKMSYPEIPDN